MQRRTGNENFGVHESTKLYQVTCYNEARYSGVPLYPMLSSIYSRKSEDEHYS